VARIYNLANRNDEALSTVLRAEHEAPEQVRHHYIARELAVQWMRNRRTRSRSDVAGLAQRLHLA
jgi:hypothetical protein